MREATDQVQAALIDPSSFPIASPWADSNLNQVIYSDIFGGLIPPISRAEAMRIPAVARARNLVVSTISRLPLLAYKKDQVLGDLEQPTWMYATDGTTSPLVRNAWTVDDLIFYGWSCWSRVNNTDGTLQRTDRIARERWSINADNVIEVDGIAQRSNQVILIPGLHEGILAYGRDVISDTNLLYRNVRQRLENPIPAIDLHQTQGEDLTDEQIDTLIARWAAARAGANGGVGFSNAAIDVRELGGTDAQLLIEARNAASLDIARLVGVSAGRIDATSPKASLNYETTTGRNQEFVDFDIALYMTPMTARLSLDDIMPRGQRAGFELEDFITIAPPAIRRDSGPTTQD